MSHQKLVPGRPPEMAARRQIGRPSRRHAEHLRAPDQRRARGAREVVVAMIDRADQREHAAGALHEAADAGQVGSPVAKQQAPDRDRCRAERHDLARAELVHRHARDQAERRIGVVEKADERGDADGVRPKAADISGTMTAGAERIAYW
jgi:hypothetical protein